MEDSSRMTVDDTRRTLDLSLANQIVAVVTAERSAEINRVGSARRARAARAVQAEGSPRRRHDARRRPREAERRQRARLAGQRRRGAAPGARALGLTLGIPEEFGVAREMNVNGHRGGRLHSCRAVDNVDQRPDIAAARTNLEVAKRNLRNTWYSFLPVLTGTEHAQRDDRRQRGVSRTRPGASERRSPSPSSTAARASEDQEPAGRRGHRRADAGGAPPPGHHPGGAGAARDRGGRGLVPGLRSSSGTSRRRTTR
jgi:hypothetical protein